MATYIKGADTYLPDIKPFTPDYKFLSAVLETKTDKYDANFKATNDLYNKVVYADLSRVDNKDKRDQYAQTIGPAIEKISGMDLSLQQNADQAQSVFAPFYEDDLIVRDIVYTSAYRKEQAMAQRLLDQGTDAAVDRYSPRGVKSLQYQMDDFINADPDKAMNMKLPKYVQNANLFKMSETILGDMDPPLSMKMDQLSENGDFIITRQNGALVTGAALQVLQQTLMKDPRVQAAYADDAFVASRDFAANGIQAGGFSSVEEGQGAWAAETIRRINEKNEIDLTKDLEKKQKQINANVNWENYQSNNGIIPDSDMAKALEEQMSLAEATQASLDARMGIRREAGLPTDSLDGNLNKAYRMLMQANLEGDLITAATSWSARDQEVTFRENKFAVQEKSFKYDMAKIRANALNDYNLQVQKAADDINLATLKGEIGNSNNSLANALQGNVVTYGSSLNIDAAVDKDGELDANTDMVQRTNIQFLTEDNKIFGEQVEDILKMLAMTNPLGDNANKDQTYGITLANGEKYRGDIESIRRKLMDTDFVPNEDNPDAMPSYNERENVNNIFTNLSSEFKNTRQNTLNDPSLTMGTDKRNQYDALYSKMFGANGTINKQSGLNQFMKTALQNHADAYALAEIEVYGEDDGKNNAVLLRDAGFPPVMNEQNQMLSREEYRALVMKGVKSGNITNPDLYRDDIGNFLRPVDGNYLEEAYTEEEVWHGNSTGTERTYTGGTMIAIDAVHAEADKYYDAIRDSHNIFLNSGKIASGDLYSTAYGRSDAKGIDAVLGPTYEYKMNPLSLNPKSEAEMLQLIGQLNTLNKNNTGYGVIPGDINARGVDAEMLMQNPTALKAWNLYKEDLNTWLNNDKRSNNDAIAPVGRLEYMPIFGQSDDPSKNKAASRFIFSDEWLASKVKGPQDSQYGALSTQEIQILRNEGSEDGLSGEASVTFVYDQSQDINTKSADNLYYSNIETAILADDNGYAEFDMPEGLSPTGTYRVIKVGNNDYNLHYSINTYKTGGTYTTRTETQPINMDYGMRGLDIHVAEFDIFLNTKREENRLAREKDDAENAKK